MPLLETNDVSQRRRQGPTTSAVELERSSRIPRRINSASPPRELNGGRGNRRTDAHILWISGRCGNTDARGHFGRIVSSFSVNFLFLMLSIREGRWRGRVSTTSTARGLNTKKESVRRRRNRLSGVGRVSVSTAVSEER